MKPFCVRSQYLFDLCLSALRDVDALKRDCWLGLAVDLFPILAGTEEAQPQCIVMKKQLCDGTAHKILSHWLAQLEQPCLVVVVRIEQTELKETCLHRREYYVARNRLLLCFRAQAIVRDSRKLRDSLIPENLSRLEVHARLVGPRDDLNTQNGVTAELKKVVVNPNLLNAQNCGPNAAQLHLSRSRRRSKLSSSITRFRRWKGVAIDLAIWSYRQIFEKNKRR